MSDILFQAGTGELEVMEFTVNKQSYAINVLKLRGIVQIDEIVPMPQSAQEISGLANIRGEMRTIIDLKVVLYNEKTVDYKKALGLLCEFNGITLVFLVDTVEGIRRIKWDDIKQNTQMQNNDLSIGTILLNEEVIIMLDFESMAMRCNLGQKFEKVDIKGSNMSRYEHIIVAEDSKVILEMLVQALKDYGFKNVHPFTNGSDAYEYIENIYEEMGEKFREKVGLLITDIEMPKMDGYTLTKKIKENKDTKVLPIVIFSSLVREELEHKGISVGADVQISKPSINELLKTVIDILDKYPVLFE